MIVFIINKPIEEVGEVYKKLMKRYIDITQDIDFKYDTIEPGIGLEINSIITVLSMEGRLREYSLKLKDTMVVEEISENSFLITCNSIYEGNHSSRVSRYSIDEVISPYHRSGYMFIAGV